jgi:hypothetical protein
MEAYVSPKRLFLQEPNVKSKKTALFIVNAVKTSNLNTALTGWSL